MTTVSIKIGEDSIEAELEEFVIMMPDTASTYGLPYSPKYNDTVLRPILMSMLNQLGIVMDERIAIEREDANETI